MWVKVTDNLPEQFEFEEKSVEVLIYVEIYEDMYLGFYKYRESIWVDGSNSMRINSVSHWAHRPAPPVSPEDDDA